MEGTDENGKTPTRKLQTWNTTGGQGVWEEHGRKIGGNGKNLKGKWKMGGQWEDHQKIATTEHNWNLHQFFLQLQKVRSRQITYVILVAHNMCFPGTHIVCTAVPPSNSNAKQHRNLQKGRPCATYASPQKCFRNNLSAAVTSHTSLLPAESVLHEV